MADIDICGVKGKLAKTGHGEDPKPARIPVLLLSNGGRQCRCGLKFFPIELAQPCRGQVGWLFRSARRTRDWTPGQALIELSHSLARGPVVGKDDSAVAGIERAQVVVLADEGGKGLPAQPKLRVSFLVARQSSAHDTPVC